MEHPFVHDIFELVRVPSQVMICLLQYFVESLTVVLPYYPTGTMERVVKEGQVRATSLRDVPS